MVYNLHYTFGLKPDSDSISVHNVNGELAEREKMVIAKLRQENVEAYIFISYILSPNATQNFLNNTEQWNKQ